MPGSSGGESIVAANPTAVMPYSLAIAFRQERYWAVDQNRYAGGEVQTSVLVGTSRKAWALALPLTAAQKETMLDFLVTAGWAGCFWFYDLWETSPKFSYDGTGAAATGRYTVRVDGPWQAALRLGEIKAEAALRLVEVS